MSQPNPNERLHLIVSGRVQGVGFRAFVSAIARQQGLTGWVRNVGYDQVEVIAEGQRPALEAFANAVQAGPRASRVDAFHAEWLAASAEFDNFAVRSSR